MGDLSKGYFCGIAIITEGGLVEYMKLSLRDCHNFIYRFSLFFHVSIFSQHIHLGLR